MIGQLITHYRILEKIGTGGMGEVYLAEDTILGRRVAMKFLPPQFTQHEERLRRFKQEAKAASALNHPNIVTIHEFGEEHGRHFIVTEFVDGETLSAFLKRNGKMNIVEVVQIATQAASALTAAHEAGIVHRDIKPANLMLRRDGYVKMLDFGLAKLVAASASENEQTNVPTKTFEGYTHAGVVMGTAPYMSPEQARGLPVDGRSDIWSLGCVLYEMLSGRSPFRGGTVTDTLVAILQAEPAPLSHTGIPDQLERIICKMLRKKKEERYQTSEELLTDFEQFKERPQFQAPYEPTPSPRRMQNKRLLIFAVVLLLIFGGLLLYRWQSSAVVPTAIRSLAVLPLQNLSGDPAQEYFADGMTEELIGKIAQIGSLRVISRTSVMRYKTANKSIPEIGSELKVDGVIEGTVQRSGGRVRVTVKLIQVATDSALWVRDYERDTEDVLKLQSDLARAVAEEIRIQVTPEERLRLESARNINPQAHENYLLGRYHLRPNEEDLRKAISYFERAIQIAPDYAAAYGSLADAWNSRGIWGVFNVKETKPYARKAAVKALALDPRQLQARLALGWIKMFDWDWTGAEQEFVLAIDIDRNSAEAHRDYGDLLSAVARHNEAIRQMHLAEQLDPLSSTVQSRYARALYRARKYQEALPRVLRAIELDPAPGNVMPHAILGELYRELGRYEEAIAAMNQVKLQGGNPHYVSATLACIYAQMGREREARKILEDLKRSLDPSRFATVDVAAIYTALGEKDEAFKVLFRMIDERSNLATHLRSDPPFESLHSDPRWKELLRRMNFQE